MPWNMLDPLLPQLNGMFFPGGAMDVSENPKSIYAGVINHIV